MSGGWCGPSAVPTSLRVANVLSLFRASSWVSAAAGNILSVLDWFWTYKLAGHVHCIGSRPRRTALLFSALLPCQSLLLFLCQHDLHVDVQVDAGMR